MNIVYQNIDQISDLCAKHRVAKLFVFGSVLSEKFKSDSDIDLIVDFKDIDIYDYADNYFNLKFALEKIFNRPVDLLEEKAINNPYLKKSIDSSKQLLYGQ